MRRGVVIGMPVLVRMRDHRADSGEIDHEAIDDRIEMLDRFLIGMAVRGPLRRRCTERGERGAELALACRRIRRRVGESGATRVVEAARRTVGEMNDREPMQRGEAAADADRLVVRMRDDQRHRHRHPRAVGELREQRGHAGSAASLRRAGASSCIASR